MKKIGIIIKKIGGEINLRRVINWKDKNYSNWEI